MKFQLKNNDFLWNALGIGINSFNSLFFMILVTRINGLGIAGIFSYAFALGCLFYYCSTYYTRPYQIANFEKFDFNSFLSTRVVTSIISLITIFLFGVISGFTNYKIAIIVLIFLFKILESISDCFYGFIHKKEKLYYVGKSMFFKSLLGILFFFLVDYFSHSLILSILALIFINLIVLVFFDLKEYYKWGGNNFKFNIINVKRILFQTFSIFIFSFFANFLYNLQKYILTYFVSDELQTIFGILIMPATIMILAGSCLINPFINKFNDYKTCKDFKSFNRLLRNIMLVLIMIGVFALLCCNYLGIPILNFIYSVSLADNKFLLLLAVTGSFFTAMVNILSGCLTILDRNKEQLIIYAIVSIISVFLSVILIKLYSISGAIYAFFISMVIIFLVYFVFYMFTMKKNCYNSDN